MDRASDLEAHYSDTGVLPRTAMLNYFWNTNWISLHMMSGMASWQNVLFWLQGIAAFCMAIGYRTKFFTFLAWFLLVSLHGRNPLVLHGGDVFQRAILFWLLFLPIEKVGSVDAALKRDPAYPKRRTEWIRATAATGAFILQYALVYRTSASLKTGKEWTEELSATYYAISLDYFRTWLGDLLLPHLDLLKLLTYIVLWWELWGPFFLVSPFYSQACRLVGVIGFIGMHLGFGLTLRLGTFFYISLAIATALLPPMFWDWLLSYLRNPKRMALKVYYLPSSTVSTTLARLLSIVLIPDTLFATTQAKFDPESGEETQAARAATPLLRCTDYYGTAYTGLEALSFVLSHSPLLWPLGWLLTTELCTSIAYSKVMQLLLSFAVHVIDADDASPFARPARSFPQRVNKLLWFAAKSVFVTLCAVTVLSWCLSNIGRNDYAPGFSARGIAYLSHLDQSWGMFAPRPPASDFYYVFEGQLDDGRKVEMFNHQGFKYWNMDRPMSWDKPTSATNGIMNHRWFKIFENYNSNARNQEIRLSVGKYVCRQWNKRHGGVDRVYEYKVWLVSELHLLNGTVVPQPNQMLWHRTPSLPLVRTATLTMCCAQMFATIGDPEARRVRLTDDRVRRVRRVRESYGPPPLHLLGPGVSKNR